MLKEEPFKKVKYEDWFSSSSEDEGEDAGLGAEARGFGGGESDSRSNQLHSLAATSKKQKHSEKPNGTSPRSSASSSDRDAAALFNQDRYEGRDGHMRLLMEKTYGGDSRFKLGQEFQVDYQDANRVKAHIPDQFMVSMTKKEREDFEVGK